MHEKKRGRSVATCVVVPYLQQVDVFVISIIEPVQAVVSGNWSPS